MGAPQYEQAGADIAGGGTAGNLAVWTTATTLGNSGVTDNGTTVSFVSRNLSSTAAQTWTLNTSLSLLSGVTGFYNAGTDGTYGDVIYIGAAAYPTTYRHRIKASVSATTTNALMTFSLNSGTSSFTDVMTLRGDGNVGIGISNPYEKLQVYGDLKVGVLANGSFVTLADEGSTSKNVGIYRAASATSLSLGGYGGITFHASSAVLGSQTERARIDSSGNFSIGYTGGTWSSTYTGMFLNRGLSFMARDGGDAYLSANAIYDSTNAWKYVASGTTASTQISFQSGATVFSRAVAGTAGSALTWLESARIDSSGRFGIGQTPTTYILETATDASFYGVRVGRGAGAVSTNTVVGSGALNANTTGSNNCAFGYLALQTNSTAVSNTAIGFQAGTSLSTGGRNTAVGESALYIAGTSVDNVAVGRYAAVYNTGSNNVAIGSAALNGINGSSGGGSNVAVGASALTASTTGAGNTALGISSGSNITTGSNNILLGANAITVAATDSNKLVIGSSGNYVATNGGATTWYTTATAQSTGVLPATCGFIRVLLNGTYVKIPVYAD